MNIYIRIRIKHFVFSFSIKNFIILLENPLFNKLQEKYKKNIILFKENIILLNKLKKNFKFYP